MLEHKGNPMDTIRHENMTRHITGYSFNAGGSNKPKHGGFNMYNSGTEHHNLVNFITPRHDA